MPIPPPVRTGSGSRGRDVKIPSQPPSRLPQGHPRLYSLEGGCVKLRGPSQILDVGACL